jgi:hypothetical protein
VLIDNHIVLILSHMPKDVTQQPTTRLLQQCAMQLQETQNPAAVVTNLARHCSSDVLQDQLDAVRYLWRHMYGDQVVKSSAEYKSEFKKIKQHVQRMQKQAHTARQQQEWDDARDDVLDFYDLSYAEQYDACKRGTAGYTGLPLIDSMLCSLVRMPAYVQALRCNSPRSVKSDGSSSTEISEHDSDDSGASSVSELSSDSTSALSNSESCITQSSVQSQPPAKQSQTSHKIECMVSEMLAIMQYPRCKYFELVCALAFMSGRSLADIVSVGDFIKGKPHKHFMNSLSFKSSESSSHHTLPILCDTATFLQALSTLRNMRPLAHTERRLVNNSHSKSANTAVKSLLGPDFVFTDLRAQYAAATYLQFGVQSGWPLQKWVQKVAGGGSRVMATPAFLAKCEKALQRISRHSD